MPATLPPPPPAVHAQVPAQNKSKTAENYKQKQEANKKQEARKPVNYANGVKLRGYAVNPPTKYKSTLTACISENRPNSGLKEKKHNYERSKTTANS